MANIADRDNRMRGLGDTSPHRPILSQKTLTEEHKTFRKEQGLDSPTEIDEKDSVFIGRAMMQRKEQQ